MESHAGAVVASELARAKRGGGGGTISCRGHVIPVLHGIIVHGNVMNGGTGKP